MHVIIVGNVRKNAVVFVTEYTTSDFLYSMNHFLLDNEEYLGELSSYINSAFDLRSLIESNQFAVSFSDICNIGRKQEFLAYAESIGFTEASFYHMRKDYTGY